MSAVQELHERTRDSEAPGTGVFRRLAPTFQEDWDTRVRPDLITELLAEAVPAVRRAGFEFVEVGDGFCHARLPLTRENTNQHGTHQALLVAMAGDYTGGLALASLIRGVPVAGIHPVFGNEAILMWLVSADLRYVEPSCEDLDVRCTVPADQVDRIREGFFAGRTQMIPLDLELRSVSGRLVATATMTYYLKHSAHLAPNSPEKRAGTMYQHMRKSSARLIANVRGRESDSPDALYRDPWSRVAAGRHGELLGERFLEVMPELGPMVAARTRHADDAVCEAISRGVRQIVLVGSGLDMRAFRFGAAEGVTWFELDLPEMLHEREQALAPLGLPAAKRVGVPLNLDFDDPATVLAATDEFDADAPVLVVFEGCSMYFEAADLAVIFQRLSALVQHPDSRMWVDVVAPEVVDGVGAPPEVKAFVEGMAKMGEPFRFGHGDPERLFAEFGLTPERVDQSDVYAPDPGSIFELYKFALLRRAL